MTSINESAALGLVCEDEGLEREARRASRRSARYSAGLTTFATSLAFFLTGMDTMIVNVALPTITADLGGDMALQQWMIDGYTLLFASLLLLAGSLSDKFGAKRMFFFGTALFGVASLLSTFAWTMLVLIVGRCLMGVAAALILPASMALINEANPDPRRRAFAPRPVGCRLGVRVRVRPAVRWSAHADSLESDLCGQRAVLPDRAHPRAEGRPLAHPCHSRSTGLVRRLR